MTRALSRRLERLEACLPPPDAEPIQHIIRFVDADGTITDSLVINHGAPARGPQKWPSQRRTEAQAKAGANGGDR
jgi:hypothetical protein